MLRAGDCDKRSIPLIAGGEVWSGKYRGSFVSPGAQHARPPHAVCCSGGLGRYEEGAFRAPSPLPIPLTSYWALRLPWDPPTNAYIHQE
jgi:hypothetical protein